MAKQQVQVSPFGDVLVHTYPSHTHIEAPSPLAGDWALGWWHAKAAGEEAVFARDFWRGSLGVPPRPSPARTEIDAFVSHWGFTADLGREAERLSIGFRGRLEAYVQGFRQGRKRGKETPWILEDCLLLARTMGFLEWWETRAPQIAFLLEAWEAGLSWAQVLDLWPGLGPEPDRGTWKGLAVPPPFSPEAQTLVNKIRRFRPGTVWVIPGHRNSSGRPLMAVTSVSDVTEPGLPFLAVRLDTPGRSIRGLSRPGHPGFLSGRTAALVWHVAPAIDDTVDLRILERNDKRTLAGVWAGTGHLGTLESLLILEDTSTAEDAKEATRGLGSACLDVAAMDSRGGLAQWAQGPRWLRTSPRDAWLPAPWGSVTQEGPRALVEETGTPSGRISPDVLESLILSPHPPQPGQILPALRFLLPDTEDGQRLRRWIGLPEKGPEAQNFQRIYAAVLECFWEKSPRVPGPISPVFQALVPVVDRLIEAPHSAWFPSSEKNHRLAEAVRKAFSPGHPTVAVLGRRATKAFWTEEHGGKPRIFAATVALVADPGEPGWRTFLTDDETESPVFTMW